MSTFAKWAFEMPVAEWGASGDCSSQPTDILVYGIGAKCHECDQFNFSGPVIGINGEGDLARRAESPWDSIVLGPGGANVPYGMVEWINQGYGRVVTLDKPLHWAVAYINSNCAPSREQMATALSMRVIVHAYGSCIGSELDEVSGKRSRVMDLPKVGNHWTANIDVFKNYAFGTCQHIVRKHKVAVAAPLSAAPHPHCLLAQWPTRAV